MKDVILIASDFHYDTTQSEVLSPFIKLLDLAKSLNATLFLNGDLFNFWFENKGKTPNNCIPMIDQIKAAIKNGLQINVLRGNRDFLMDEHFVKSTGANLILDDQYFIKDFNAIVTHGDQFELSWKYKFYRKFIRSKAIRFIAKRIPIRFVLKVFSLLKRNKNQLALKKYTLPEKIICPFKHRMILGHYHQENIRILENGTIIFCPAFDESAKVLMLTKNHFEFLKVN
jgi:UDP-2,3-diacylglucosamine pyrophosphatase LpxH